MMSARYLRMNRLISTQSTPSLQIMISLLTIFTMFVMSSQVLANSYEQDTTDERFFLDYFEPQNENNNRVEIFGAIAKLAIAEMAIGGLGFLGLEYYDPNKPYNINRRKCYVKISYM